MPYLALVTNPCHAFFNQHLGFDSHLVGTGKVAFHLRRSTGRRHHSVKFLLQLIHFRRMLFFQFFKTFGSSLNLCTYLILLYCRGGTLDFNLRYFAHCKLTRMSWRSLRSACFNRIFFRLRRVPAQPFEFFKQPACLLVCFVVYFQQPFLCRFTCLLVSKIFLGILQLLLKNCDLVLKAGNLLCYLRSTDKSRITPSLFHSHQSHRIQGMVAFTTKTAEVNRVALRTCNTAARITAIGTKSIAPTHYRAAESAIHCCRTATNRA